MPETPRPSSPDRSPSPASGDGHPYAFPGHVEPGGPSTVLDLGPVTLTKASVGPTDNNAYVVAAAEGPVVLVDCAADADRLTEVVGEREVGVIVTTHQHPDHIRVLAEMAERTGADLVCGAPDMATIQERTGTTQRGLWDGDVVRCGDISMEVIGLVGHTPGSITLVIDTPDNPAHLLTGDAIFPGGLGKTSSPELFESLWNDARTKVFDRFGDETIFHPGHGDDSTIGAERPQLQEWRERGW